MTIADELSAPFAGPDIAFSPQGVQTATALMQPPSHFIVKSPGSKILLSLRDIIHSGEALENIILFLGLSVSHNTGVVRQASGSALVVSLRFI